MGGGGGKTTSPTPGLNLGIQPSLKKRRRNHEENDDFSFSRGFGGVLKLYRSGGKRGKKKKETSVVS